MSTFIFPSSKPPSTEVKKTQLYKKTELKPKIEPPTKMNETPVLPVVSSSVAPPTQTPDQTQYSHILSILIQYNTAQKKPMSEMNKNILKECAKILHNMIHTKMLGNNIFVPIAWVQQGSIYSNKYHMSAELFGDVAIKKHTALLLNDVIQQIDDQFDFAFSKKEIVLIFDLTKPLT